MTQDTHQHGSEWGTRADELEAEAEIGLAWAGPAMDWIGDQLIGHPVTRVVDVGAGPGVHSVALATRFPVADVVAVDGEPTLLARIAMRAAAHKVVDRVQTRVVDLADRLDQLPEADLMWVSKVLHHLPDQDAALRALRSRLQPGGLLAVVEGGLPMRFLPTEYGLGEPGLLARLDAAANTAVEHVLAVDRGDATARPTHDWPVQLAAAGFASVDTRTFLLDVPAPVPPAVRARLIDWLGRTRTMTDGRLTPADAAAVDCLLDPAEPLGLHQRTDLFLLSAETVHVGHR